MLLCSLKEISFLLSFFLSIFLCPFFPFFLIDTQLIKDNGSACGNHHDYDDYEQKKTYRNTHILHKMQCCVGHYIFYNQSFLLLFFCYKLYYFFSPCVGNTLVKKCHFLYLSSLSNIYSLILFETFTPSKKKSSSILFFHLVLTFPHLFFSSFLHVTQFCPLL